MNDRLFSLLLLFTALLYGFAAITIKVPFAYDPLGPRPVPIVLAILLAFLAVILIVNPQKNDRSKALFNRQFLHLAAIILFYQVAWSLLGFLLATTISVYLLSRLFNCSWMQGLMTALLVSVCCYGLFNFILKIPLPLGALFSYGSS